MTIYPDVPPRPVLQIAMPRAPRIYATGTPSELITLHPSYLALSRYAKVRQRHYRNLLSPSPDSRLDCRDARWTTQRAVGSREFLNRYLPLRGRRRMIPLPQQIRGLGV